MIGGVNPVERNPVTLTMVAAFLFLAALISLVVGTSLLFPGQVWNGLWNLNRPAHLAFEKLGSLPGFFLLALGAGAGAAGAGLLKRRKWAWWFAVALFTTNGLGDLVTLFATHDLIRGGSGILIACIFLICLNRPEVKRAFR